MSLTINIPPNSIVIIRTYPALPPSPAPEPSFPVPGNYQVQTEGGESLGMKKGRAGHVFVCTTFAPSSFTLSMEEEGIVQLSTILDGRSYFLDKWHGDIGKNNHEVCGYALIREWERRGKKNMAQYWRLHPCETGFKLSPLCSSDLFLFIDEDGFARCNSVGQVFSFVPV